MAWYDSRRSGELTSRIGKFRLLCFLFNIASDTQKIQNALGDKVGITVQMLSTFFAGWAVGLAQGWRMSLVILSVAPLLVLAGFSCNQFCKTK